MDPEIFEEDDEELYRELNDRQNRQYLKMVIITQYKVILMMKFQNRQKMKKNACKI